MGLRSAKKKAWGEFSKYIRLRDALLTTRTKTHVLCISCGKKYPAFGKGCAQAGHFIPGRGNSILFDEIAVNAQCYNCNFNLRGNWVAYEQALILLCGKKIVEELKAKKNKIVKYTESDYREIAKKYKKKYSDLLFLKQAE
jgi:hypothetical protein